MAPNQTEYNVKRRVGDQRSAWFREKVNEKPHQAQSNTQSIQ